MIWQAALVMVVVLALLAVLAFRRGDARRIDARRRNPKPPNYLDSPWGDL